MKRILKTTFVATIAFLVSLPVFSQKQKVYTVAIFPFAERGSGVKDMGKQASDLLWAALADNEHLWFVDRENFEKVLDELEVNLSGMVKQDEAVKAGQMVGAQLIITGSIFKIKNQNYLIAKVISTETTKMTGAKSSGTNLEEMTKTLSADISKLIKTKIPSMLPRDIPEKNLVAELKKEIIEAKKPLVYINIEEAHIGANPPDPAAQTELIRIFKDLGFPVTENENEADIKITGEAFSEFAARLKNLVSVKSRVEIKALNKKGDVLFSDSNTNIMVGLGELITGKSALKKSANLLAAPLIRSIIKK